MNGLNPGDQTPLETTIGYEHVAVDLTSWLARHEPDPMLKQALDFALLEDFDHLYRYANLYELLDGKDATALTDHLTEITPGRPTVVEHRHPHDDVRGHYETHSVDPLSRMHVMTIIAAEQHNEIYMYWSMLQNEQDRRIESIWELHLDMEIGQLHAACELLRKYEGIEPEELLPKELPDTAVTFEPNKSYVREILASQIDLAADGPDYVLEADLPADHPSRRYREIVNEGGAPSELVIDQNRAERGREFRDETDGDHPVPELRSR